VSAEESCVFSPINVRRGACVVNGLISHTACGLAPDMRQRDARCLDRLRASVASGTLRDGMTRRLIAVAVVGALVCGQLLAYADPPDPTWIAGFWDDADFDDVIIRVTSTSSVSETGLLSALAPHWMPIGTLALAGDRPDPNPTVAPHRPRGPPLA